MFLFISFHFKYLDSWKSLSVILVIFVCFSVGRGELHGLRQGYQLAVVRRLRRPVPPGGQLAVDAVYRARSGQANPHRDEVLCPGLFDVPRRDEDLQGDLLSALPRVRRRTPLQSRAKHLRPRRSDCR